jgi:exodeoxyribonuclease VII small subunit
MSTKIKFEEALSKLEDSLRRLESGNMSLDESIKVFEEAVKLVRVCNDRLDSAENRVRMLVAGEDGSVTDVPFDAFGNET